MTQETNGKTTAVEVARILPQDITSWGGAAVRGLQARREREAIIKEVLSEGPDFGRIPGTSKDTLLKPGAEKITDCLNLYPDYVCIGKIEDWDRPLFHYQYRTILRERGSDKIVATGIGSCNSMESKYRWRWSERVCPQCKKPAIIKGKEEFGGGWLCYRKKGGCGAHFADDAQEIVGQDVGRILNEDIFDQVNTIDKMGQKRSLIAAALNLGFSEQFTQDLDDIMPVADEEQKTKPEEQSENPAPQQEAGKKTEAKPRASKGGDWTEFERRKKALFSLLCSYFKKHPQGDQDEAKSAGDFIFDMTKAPYKDLTVDGLVATEKALSDLLKEDKRNAA